MFILSFFYSAQDDKYVLPLLARWHLLRLQYHKTCSTVCFCVFVCGHIQFVASQYKIYRQICAQVYAGMQVYKQPCCLIASPS